MNTLTTDKPLAEKFDFATAQDYMKYHGKVVKLAGNIWKIIATGLGNTALVSVECFYGPSKGEKIDLIKSRTPLSKDIRFRIKNNLVS